MLTNWVKEEPNTIDTISNADINTDNNFIKPATLTTQPAKIGPSGRFDCAAFFIPTAANIKTINRRY